MESKEDENGNINCLYCENCTNCVNCIGCTNCTNCIDCTNCVNCTNCEMCTHLKSCEDCYDCTNCEACTDCQYCEGLLCMQARRFNKDYLLYEKDVLVFPSKGRCLYSVKLESFFLLHGFTPYNRMPKKTDFIKKSKAELLASLDDMDDLQSVYDSQGVQIAWNIGNRYKRYWVTTTEGKFKVNYTIYDLALFIVMNKLAISRTDIQEFAGMGNIPNDLRMFQEEFNISCSNLQSFLDINQDKMLKN